MSTLTERDTTTSLALLPRVNLLPPEIEEARRFRRVQAGLGGGVAAAVLIVGGLTFLAAGQVSDAQTQLDKSKAEQSALQAQTAKYAEVPALYAKVDAREAQLDQAMGSEVRWSYFLNDISLTVPGKVWLTKLSVTQDVDGTAAAAAAVSPATAAFPTTGIATIEATGHAYTHNDVAAWLAALGRQKSVDQPYFTSSVKELIGDEDAVTFTSQATVTDDALSKRWTQKASS